MSERSVVRPIMVEIDWSRCGFYGGCVSVCPVGAIELAETELLIDETCVGCGLCLSACPVGALREGTKGTRGAEGLPCKHSPV